MSAYNNLAPGVTNADLEVKPLLCECCDRVIPDEQDVDIFAAILLCDECEKEQKLN